jgi:hypothetical protein
MTNVAVPADLMGRIHERLRQGKALPTPSQSAAACSGSAGLVSGYGKPELVHNFPGASPGSSSANRADPVAGNIGSETVAALLEEHGISLPDELRRRWDFRHLKAIYYTYEQGRWLCNLEFRRDDASAHVVVKLIPRRWCRPDQLEEFRHRPGTAVLGIEEGGPYVAFVIGQPGHIASFYQKGDPTG